MSDFFIATFVDLSNSLAEYNVITHRNDGQNYKRAIVIN